MIKKQLILYLFLAIGFSTFSQKIAIQKNNVGFRSEFYGGLAMHSAGWGFNLTRGKFKTSKITTLYSLEFVSMKHPKESKINYSSSLSESSPFKFGKLNSFYTTRLNYGKKYMLFEKFRNKGVEIFGTWQTGLNIGLIKPIYLEILRYDTNDLIIDPKPEERYDPNIHTESNIWGKGSFSSGFSSIKVVLGAHLKGGFMFEFSRRRERILAIETGVIIDYYPTKVPIMAYNKENDLFFNLYINVLFGKKYYE